jgi:RNA recognition motif-containing protein
MTKRIYVGNISWNSSEQDIRELFEGFGAVERVDWVADRYTGQFRGFAFITMEDEDADKAIAALNGNDFGGRRLKVEEARDSRSGRRPS